MTTFWEVIRRKWDKSEYTTATLSKASMVSIHRLKKINADPGDASIDELQSICSTLGLELKLSLSNAPDKAE